MQQPDGTTQTQTQGHDPRLAPSVVTRDWMSRTKTAPPATNTVPLRVDVEVNELGLVLFVCRFQRLLLKTKRWRRGRDSLFNFRYLRSVTGLTIYLIETAYLSLVPRIVAIVAVTCLLFFSSKIECTRCTWNRDTRAASPWKWKRPRIQNGLRGEHCQAGSGRRVVGCFEK